MKFLLTLLLGAALVPLAAAETPARKPNLIVIMADDLGYQDVGFNGCKDIPTPHIDRIAAEGVRFDSAYVPYPVCAPSRAGFMTGRYPQRFGFERNPQYKPADPAMGLSREETTIADSLRAAGYATGLIGKWHLGAHLSLHPLERGFDEFFGHRGGGHIYFCDELTIRDSGKAKNEAESYRTFIERGRSPVKTTGYLTDVFSQEAVEFIARHKERPFFLFLSYNAPHAPLQATETYLSCFPHIADDRRRTYAAMVSALDDGVGRVLDTLQTHGLSNDTMIFFLSDNGGPEAVNASDNGILRGGKSDV
jgi:arylsulfatase A-like enzyme